MQAACVRMELSFKLHGHLSFLPSTIIWDVAGKLIRVTSRHTENAPGAFVPTGCICACLRCASCVTDDPAGSWYELPSSCFRNTDARNASHVAPCQSLNLTTFEMTQGNRGIINVSVFASCDEVITTCIEYLWASNLTSWIIIDRRWNTNIPPCSEPS